MADNYPMKTAEATDRFTCSHCKAGCDCPYCSCTCLESRTCSMRCHKCNERIWFQGDAHNAPRNFDCPYCGTKQKNIFNREEPKPEPIRVEHMRPGMKVHYQPEHYGDKFENGIIKGIQVRMFDGTPQVFVVYHCDNNWHKYQDYTAANSDPKDLYPGWK